jgi:hypothetical protein
VDAGGCSLCNDGSEPPDITLSPEYFDGLPCGQYVTIGSHINEDTDADNITC